MIEKFSLSAISKIDDGRIQEAFNQALKRCIDDCNDRPALEEGRKLALTVTVVPQVGDDGRCETCNVSFQVLDTQPKRRSRTYNMKTVGGGLFFNELAPSDVRQQTLDGAQPMKAVPNAG